MEKSKKMVLNSIDPMSAAKVLAVMGVVWGLLITVLALLGVAITSYMGRLYQGFGMMGLGTYEIILLPILYGIVGFISGYVGAWLYNYVVKFVGGVKVELK